MPLFVATKIFYEFLLFEITLCQLLVCMLQNIKLVCYLRFLLKSTETYSKASQICKMVLFVKIVNA